MSFKEKMVTVAHSVGDTYHQHIYAHIAPGIGKLNKSKRPVSDYIGPIALYAPELLGVALLNSFYALSSVEPDARITLSVPSLVGVATIATSFAGFYGLNTLRTPLSDMMRLHESETFDIESDMAHVIEQLNKRSQVEQEDFDITKTKASTAVKNFMQDTVGYMIDTKDSVKQTHFARMYRWKYGLIAWVNLWAQEVVVTGEEFPETLAHEFVHLQGEPRERFAQLGGVVAQIESNEPFLEYLGYRWWLTMLAEVKADSEYEQKPADQSVGAFIAEQLRGAGLNDKTLQEITAQQHIKDHAHDDVQSYSRLTKAVINHVLERMPQGISDRIPKSWIEFMSTPEPFYMQKILQVFLKLTGQKNVSAGYYYDPLRLLHAYLQEQNQESNA